MSDTRWFVHTEPAWCSALKRHLNRRSVKVTGFGQQVARKWGDEAKEPAVLDFSEKPPERGEGADGDSAPDQDAAAAPDLTMKSRVDEDEDAEESEEEDEG